MSETQYKFAEFQLDCASFELRRQGRSQKSERISLERIRMELLILLLERRGSVVTRQEIIDRLWGTDVFVDRILEGSIDCSENQLHMTVQLIYAPTDSHVPRAY